ncbi:MAG: hypothetical protein IPJ65_41775 [Archangiaceae bacterium]|nr:hypothetical protein [Archangiaceae bacterium]
MLTRARVLALATLGASCMLSIPPYEERACDAEHDCLPGWQCVQGACRSSGGLAGGGASGGLGGGSGGATAGGGAAGGQAWVDAGITWLQVRDGFGAYPKCSGCTLRVDAGNAVSATVVDSDNDFAFGRVQVTAPLTGAGGKAQGYLRLDAAPPSRRSPFFHLFVTDAGSGVGQLSVLSLAVEGGALVSVSEAGALATAQFSSSHLLPDAGRFLPGTDYHLDVRWKQGVFVDVFVDGLPAIPQRQVTPSVGTHPVAGTELRLGISTIAPGNSTPGWSDTLWGWAVADDADSPWP